MCSIRYVDYRPDHVDNIIAERLMSYQFCKVIFVSISEETRRVCYRIVIDRFWIVGFLAGGIGRTMIPLHVLSY